MSQKQKTETLQSTIENVATGLTVGAMALAASLTAVEIDHFKGHTTVQADASHAHVSQETTSHEDPMRRGMEETRHNSISYGATMRSHPTAGTV